ncbi:hypothetical protein F9K78_13085 [Brucella pseudintermedia]|nr:hypothetical protein F9K78_13085 [Brucella pseudintermedia]
MRGPEAFDLHPSRRRGGTATDPGITKLYASERSYPFPCRRNGPAIMPNPAAAFAAAGIFRSMTDLSP